MASYLSSDAFLGRDEVRTKRSLLLFVLQGENMGLISIKYLCSTCPGIPIYMDYIFPINGVPSEYCSKKTPLSITQLL